MRVATALGSATTLALFASAFTRPGFAPKAANRWYVIRIAGEPTGWMHDVRTASDTCLSVTTTMRLVFNRLGSSVAMEMTAQSIESMQGRFLSSTVLMRLSNEPTETTASVTGDSLRVRSRAGDHDFVRMLPLSRPVLGPAAIDALTGSNLKRVGDSVSYGSYDPAAASPGVVTRVLRGIDTIDLAGTRRTARRVVERSSATPMAITYWIDSAGTVLRSSYESPFGKTKADLVDSATALAANAGGSFSPEQYARTLVRTRLRLPQARRLVMLRVALTRRDSSLRWPSFDEPGQHVISRAADTIVLEIDRQQVSPGQHRFPVAGTQATREFLEPNAYIQPDEPALHSLARRILGSETDAWRAALALERWVADSMRFDLGVAFAPSVEVYEHRRGTCVAYATLLATLTRSVGIPSRVAFGFGYVNGIFGGHAWTEVLIGKSWLGIDAALLPDSAVDAARFSFTHASLAGGPAELTSSLGGQMYGRIDAQVLAYRVEGESEVRVASGQPPYRIRGDVYSNPSLRLSLRKPRGSTFTELDATWPDMTIAAVALASGDTVELSSADRASLASISGDHAVIVIPNGAEFYVLEARGPHPAKALLEVLPGFKPETR